MSNYANQFINFDTFMNCTKKGEQKETPVKKSKDRPSVPTKKIGRIEEPTGSGNYYYYDDNQQKVPGGWHTDPTGKQLFLDPDQGGRVVTGWQRIYDSGKRIAGPHNLNWTTSMITVGLNKISPFTDELIVNKRTYAYYFDKDGYMYQPPKNAFNKLGTHVDVFPHQIEGTVLGFFMVDTTKIKTKYGELSADSNIVNYEKSYGPITYR
ncbi:hypothetical protein OCF15_28920 [Bacillus cereus]|nr:hypothetical protein [Bacillus cereus]